MAEADSLHDLPRLLPTLTADVLAAPPPPVPTLSAPFAVRPVDAEGSDPGLIAEWMSRPHLVTAWKQDWPVAQWRAYLRAQNATTFSRPVIIDYHGKASAYAEIYRAAMDIIAPCYDAQPHDLGAHIAVADTENTGRGLAPPAMIELVAKLFELDPLCNRVMYDPDPANRNVCKMLERAGCTYLGEHDLPTRRMALYCTPRSPEHTPRAR